MQHAVLVPHWGLGDNSVAILSSHLSLFIALRTPVHPLALVSRVCVSCVTGGAIAFDKILGTIPLEDQIPLQAQVQDVPEPPTALRR